MVWDLFGRKNNVRISRMNDPLDDIIQNIEKFAPRDHKDDRVSHYYNYRTMEAYMKPLQALLLFISEQKNRKDEPAQFARELFYKLKDFYDIKNKLSPAEAIQDISFKRKLSQILKIFFNVKDDERSELEGYLKQLERKK